MHRLMLLHCSACYIAFILLASSLLPFLLLSFLPLSTETQCSPLTSTVWLGMWRGLPSPPQSLQLSLQMARSMCLTSTSTNMNRSVRSQVREREGSTLSSKLLSIQWSLRVGCGRDDFILELSKKYYLCKSLGLSSRINSPLTGYFFDSLSSLILRQEPLPPVSPPILSCPSPCLSPPLPSSLSDTEEAHQADPCGLQPSPPGDGDWRRQCEDLLQFMKMLINLIRNSGKPGQY